jgi:hypothetical protein
VNGQGGHDRSVVVAAITGRRKNLGFPAGAMNPRANAKRRRISKILYIVYRPRDDFSLCSISTFFELGREITLSFDYDIVTATWRVTSRRRSAAS